MIKIILTTLLLAGFVYLMYYGYQHDLDVTRIVNPRSSSAPKQPVKTDTDIHDAVDFVK